ncbi:Hypothetical_protein [Hexamita inflata]|uniref:Hypothetical_protein n=1 Tax=Hexamita inflata TaxID=28002 RepID=A0AA86UZP6_9EUKA|nr:Hypothetical protein HINF_LOCUS62444 [Hexamita inflata]
MNHDRILLKSKEQTIWLQSMQLSNAVSEASSANALLQEQQQINEHLQHEIEQLQNQLQNVHANQSAELQAENERLKLQVQNDLNDAFEKQTQFDAEKQTSEDQKVELQRQLEGSQRDNEALKSELQKLHQDMEEYRLKQIEQSNAKENANNLKQISALQRQVEFVTADKQELSEANLQLAAENQKLLDQLAQQQRQQQELVAQLEQTKRENAHMQTQLQGQVNENNKMQAKFNFIEQELISELNITPQQIGQFSYDLRQYIQELLDYQDKQNLVIQQVQQSTDTSDKEIMKTQSAVIPETSNILQQQNDLLLNTNTSDQETTAIQTNTVVIHETTQVATDNDIPTKSQQKQDQLTSYIEPNYSINQPNQQVNELSRQTQQQELIKKAQQSIFSYCNEAFSFLQITFDELKAIHYHQDKQDVQEYKVKEDLAHRFLNRFMIKIMKKHQYFDQLILSQRSNQFSVVQCCYLINQLIKYNFLKENEFNNAATIRNTENSFPTKLFKYILKESCLTQLIQNNEEQINLHNSFCEKIDQEFELIDQKRLNDRFTLKDNQTEQKSFVSQPVQNNDSVNDAFIFQTQQYLSQEINENIINNNSQNVMDQTVRTPVKQKTQKSNSPKEMSIMSIDSDTPVNETLVTKTQKCSQKPLEPRCATTDHCFDLALRNALQKSFKKEDPEMFDRFSKKQLIEYVEKNANANDNFWRLVLSQCSQYFPDKQNSQNQLVSIKKYFLVKFLKRK